jgi:hypothetical protein
MLNMKTHNLQEYHEDKHYIFKNRLFVPSFMASCTRDNIVIEKNDSDLRQGCEFRLKILNPGFLHQ